MSTPNEFDTAGAETPEKLTEVLVSLGLEWDEAVSLVRQLLKVSPRPSDGNWVRLVDKEKGYSWSIRRDLAVPGFTAERRPLVTEQ